MLPSPFVTIKLAASPDALGSLGFDVQLCNSNLLELCGNLLLQSLGYLESGSQLQIPQYSGIQHFYLNFNYCDCQLSLRFFAFRLFPLGILSCGHYLLRRFYPSAASWLLEGVALTSGIQELSGRGLIALIAVLGPS